MGEQKTSCFFKNLFILLEKRKLNIFKGNTGKCMNPSIGRTQRTQMRTWGLNGMTQSSKYYETFSGGTCFGRGISTCGQNNLLSSVHSTRSNNPAQDSIFLHKRKKRRMQLYVHPSALFHKSLKHPADIFRLLCVWKGPSSFFHYKR